MKIQFLSRRNHFNLLCKELHQHNIECNIINNKLSRTFLATPSNYYINSINSDLLVTHNPYHGLSGAKEAKKRNKVDRIALRLKADHWAEQKATNLPIRNRLGYLIKKNQYSQSIDSVDFVIAISKYIQKISKKNGLKKKTYLMYNGVDINRFNEIITDIKYKTELLCVMNFNIHQKIEAVKTFLNYYSESDLDYIITFLGDGLLLDYIRKHAKKLGVQHLTDFKGYVNNVEDYYCNCEMVLHPTDLESFGMTLLEAGASSKPCIASNVGAIPEIILHNETGYIASSMDDFIDGVDAIMSDPEKRKKMGESAKKRVHNNFTWKKIAETFITILKQEDLYIGEDHI